MFTKGLGFGIQYTRYSHTINELLLSHSFEATDISGTIAAGKLFLS